MEEREQRTQARCGEPALSAASGCDKVSHHWGVFWWGVAGDPVLPVLEKEWVGLA